MALFKRSDLEAQGFTKEQIEYVMTESGRSLSANYVLKSDVQAQIDEAVKGVQPVTVDPTTTPEYMAIAEERDMLRITGSEDFASVKPKFREQVFKMLNRGEDAPAVADQLKGIQEKWDEMFITEDSQQSKNTPQYSQNPGRTGTNPESEEDKLVQELSKQW